MTAFWKPAFWNHFQVNMFANVLDPKHWFREENVLLGIFYMHEYDEFMIMIFTFLGVQSVTRSFWLNPQNFGILYLLIFIPRPPFNVENIREQRQKWWFPVLISIIEHSNIERGEGGADRWWWMWLVLRSDFKVRASYSKCGQICVHFYQAK